MSTISYAGNKNTTSLPFRIFPPHNSYVPATGNARNVARLKTSSNDGVDVGSSGKGNKKDRRRRTWGKRRNKRKTAESMEDCTAAAAVGEAGCPEVLLILGEGRKERRQGRKREGKARQEARKEEQAQRNANGRAGFDMQRKKYLRRARTVEYCVKAEAGKTLLSAPRKSAV